MSEINFAQLRSVTMDFEEKLSRNYLPFYHEFVNDIQVSIKI